MAKAEEPKIEVYDVKERVRKSAKVTDTWVRKHPWESVGIAAMIGGLLSRLFFRKR